MGVAIGLYLLTQPLAPVFIAGAASGLVLWVATRTLGRAERPIILRRHRRVCIPVLMIVTVALLGIAFLRAPDTLSRILDTVAITFASGMLLSLLFAVVPRWWRIFPAALILVIVVHATIYWGPVTIAEVHAMRSVPRAAEIAEERVTRTQMEARPIPTGTLTEDGTGTLDLALVRAGVRDDGVVITLVPAIPMVPDSSANTEPLPLTAVAGQLGGRFATALTIAHTSPITWWLPAWRVDAAAFSLGERTRTWERERWTEWSRLPMQLTRGLSMTEEIELTWPRDEAAYIQPGLYSLRLRME